MKDLARGADSLCRSCWKVIRGKLGGRACDVGGCIVCRSGVLRLCGVGQVHTTTGVFVGSALCAPSIYGHEQNLLEYS